MPAFLPDSATSASVPESWRAAAPEVFRQFDVIEATAQSEIVLDVVRNAANKIAVAFGADAPKVSDGVEFFDVDATGTVVADVDMSVVRAATAV